MNAQDVVRAVVDKTGLEPVKVTDETHYLRIVGRLLHNQQALINLFDYLNMVTEQGVAWTVDTSKWYFRPKGSPQRYAWRIIFQAEVGLPYDQITQLIQEYRQPTAAPGGGPLEEVRLGSTNANRNAYNRRGKGAAPMGKAKVGKAFKVEE